MTDTAMASRYERRIAELEAENERLNNILAEGVHSCSIYCQRPMCVMQRKYDELKAELSSLRNALKKLAEGRLSDES
jgi:prefoldin subunit 5